MHYPSDVQPIFDRLCVSCHGNAEKLAGGLDLRGTPTQKFCASYESLVPERRKGSQNRDPGLLGVVIGENHPKTGNVEYLPAGSLGARTSVLAAMLRRGKIALADAAQQARAERLAKKISRCGRRKSRPTSFCGWRIDRHQLSVLRKLLGSARSEIPRFRRFPAGADVWRGA